MTKRSEFFDKLIIVWGMMIILGIAGAVLAVLTVDHPVVGIFIIISLLVSAGAVAVHVWSKP